MIAALLLTTASVTPYADRLAEMPMIVGPAGWGEEAPAVAWRAIATASRREPQAARWRLARSLIASRRGPEASGVLETMRRDEPDLALAPLFRLAMGAAAAESGRTAEARQALAHPGLAANPEACAWRLWAASTAGDSAAALAEAACAHPAIQARAPAARRPFRIAGALAALGTGQPVSVARWLSGLPATDGAAALLRGRASLAQGQAGLGRRRLEQAARSGTAPERREAQFRLIEAAVTTGGKTDPVALDRMLLGWRGDAIERRGLMLRYQLARQAGDRRMMLASGATLVRYHQLGAALPPLLEDLRGQLAAGLEPGSKVALVDAAGLYWDYRDVAPAGAEGDLMVARLAARLQEAGLYGRAADLLNHQMLARSQDIARGPLSVRVAGLYILAGRPADALTALRRTDGPRYTDAMIADRRRVEAVALDKLGRTGEALAVLDDVPDGVAVRAAIAWRRRDWPTIAAASAALPNGPLGNAGAAAVLRHAVALAMLAREADLVQLRARYRAAFAGSPSAPLFDLLTGPPSALAPDRLAAAMLAVPTTSPVGPLGELIEAR